MREIARIMICSGILLLPFTAAAADDCRIIEYADHVEAVCSGEPGVTGQPPLSAGKQAPNGAEVSRIRKDLAKIRAMNGRRFDLPAPQTAPGTASEDGRKDH